MTSIVDRISTLILGSPLAVKVEHDLAEERLAQQHALAEQLRTHDTTSLEVSAGAARDLAVAREDLDRQQAVLDRVRALYLSAAHVVTCVSLESDGQRRRIEKQVRDLASPAIAAFLATLRSLEAETWQLMQSQLETNKRTDAVIGWSNRVSGTARLTAIRQAMVEADKLIFVPLRETELVGRLALLREAIPEIELFLRPNVEARPSQRAAFR